MIFRNKLLIILFFLSTSQVFAQSQVPRKSSLSETLGNIRYGLIVGGNYFKINKISSYAQADEQFSKSYGTGFMLGLLAEIEVNKYIALQPEIAFSQKVSNFEYQSDLGSDRMDENGNNIRDLVYQDSRVKISALEIPIMTKMKWNLSRVKQAYLELGPQIDFLLNNSKEYHFKYIAETTPPTVLSEGHSQESLSERTHSVNIGLNIGLGINIHFLSIFSRYQMGLTDISKDTPNSKANGIYFGVGIYL